jgi:hypothetical protein
MVIISASIFYGADMDEIRRTIVDCEWPTTNSPCRYTVIAQFIATKSEDSDANDEDEEYVSYFIDNELYIYISAAPAVDNREFALVEYT